MDANNWRRTAVFSPAGVVSMGSLPGSTPVFCRLWSGPTVLLSLPQRPKWNSVCATPERLGNIGPIKPSN
jgi:hypothetical protein